MNNLVMTTSGTCSQCSSALHQTKDDLAFYEKVSPIFQGHKALIPPLTLCPDCRLQRRMAWRNDQVRENADAMGLHLLDPARACDAALREFGRRR